MQKGGVVPERMPEVPRRMLEAVREATEIPRLERVEKVVSPTDGFAKYVFRGDGEGVFEAVRIPLLHRPGDEKYIVCVSSQVGCAMGCAFCATGRMGFRRNLAAWEIVDQVMHIRDDSRAPGARRRVHGHGRADAQLRPRHAGLRGDVRPVRPGHRGQGASPSRPSASCPASAASPRSGGRTG